MGRFLFITKIHLFSSKKLPLLLLAGFFLLSCKEKPGSSPALFKTFPHHLQGYLIIEQQLIPVAIATTPAQQTKGLSGTPSSQFTTTDAMLFHGRMEGPRSFWMPNTYFDLDIFFLDKKFQIVAIERDVPHHPGVDEPPPIYRTQTIYSQYILEMRANSAHSKKLKRGDKLNWKQLPF